MKTFLSIQELKTGSIDAINYTAKSDKDFLNRVFFKDSFLEKLLEQKRYFLIGEKGTGKTAYAAFVTNNNYKNFRATSTSMTSTDYQKFFELKKMGHLPLSNFEDVWRVILLLLLADSISKIDPDRIFIFDKFRNLKSAIDQYYNNAFRPEIVNAIEFARNSEGTVELISKFMNVGGKRSTHDVEKGSGFQTNLLFIEKQFKEAISDLKIEQNQILFIDGIDVRPSSIEFDEYMGCIRDLAYAAWSLNSEFLSNIKDSKGRIKIVLLLRPDIFNSINFHNANGRLRDNSVVLDWQTEYKNYRTSRIFKLIDGTLAKQENQPKELAVGEAWDYYFPYTLPNMRIAEKIDNPFIAFLRNSFYRPRDVISYLDIMRQYMIQNDKTSATFSDEIFVECQSDYSEYLLAEVKDHLAFYYTETDFAELIGFFAFLKGNMRFNWSNFSEAYSKNRASNKHKALTIKALTDGPEEFLQFLYSLNVIGYDEITSDKTANFVHWSFRDRTPTVLNPKIPPNLGSTGRRPYTIHPGLARALKVGNS